MGTPTTPNISAGLIDATAGQITVEGLGEIVVMAYWDEDAQQMGVRVMHDMAADTPIQIGPA